MDFSYPAIQKSYHLSKAVMGFAHFDNLKHEKYQKRYFYFLIFIFCFFIVNCGFSAVTLIEEDKFKPLINTFSGCLSLMLLPMKMILIKKQEDYEDFLIWCDDWHLKEFEVDEEEAIQQIFQECNQRVKKLFFQLVILSEFLSNFYFCFKIGNP